MNSNACALRNIGDSLAVGGVVLAVIFFALEFFSGKILVGVLEAVAALSTGIVLNVLFQVLADISGSMAGARLEAERVRRLIEQQTGLNSEDLLPAKPARPVQPVADGGQERVEYTSTRIKPSRFGGRSIFDKED
jgi:hypothetical protein